MSGDASLPSDVRLADLRTMEDVEPIGRLLDGQTVYRFRLKGDAKRRVGLIAQEVAQVVPEAVAARPDGFLMVDYRRATERAAAIGAELSGR